jgi:hypothetical protein
MYYISVKGAWRQRYLYVFYISELTGSELLLSRTEEMVPIPVALSSEPV